MTDSTPVYGSPEHRTALIAVFRTVLDLVEADDFLRVPELSRMDSVGVRFYLADAYADWQMRYLEENLPCEFTGRISDDGRNWQLTGALDGIRILVSAPAEYVADRTVTGMVEQVEWTRRTAPAATGTDGTEDAAGGAA